MAKSSTLLASYLLMTRRFGSQESEGWLRNRNAALQSEDYQKSEGSPTHNGHPLRPTLAVTRFGSAIHQC
jgi:hypothetical protein